jgi:diguanylate cyclase
VAGIRIHRPTALRGWYLLAAGVGFQLAGDLAWDVYDLVLHRSPSPSVADVFYFAGYPLLMLACITLSRPRAANARRDALLDGAIAAIGAATLAWQFVVMPRIQDPSLTGAQLLVSVAYPVMDLVLIGVVVRMLDLTGLRVRSTVWLLTGFSALLVSDLVFSGLLGNAAYLNEEWLNAGWLLFYIALAVAALHPTMTGISHASAERSTRLGIGGILMLAPALIAGPAVMVAGHVANEFDPDLVMAAVVTGILDLLVLGRVGSALVQRARAEDALERSAFSDSMTGLANRALCLDRLGQALTRARRLGGSVGVLHIDLDRFRVVNEELGHDAGDQVIIAAARRIEGVVRETDTVARLSGDEFVVIAEDADGGPGVEGLAERIHAVLHESVALHDHEVALRASIGMARSGGGERTAAGLLGDAAIAMYQAKDRGRNRSEFFDPSMRSNGAPRIDVENGLRLAIEWGEFHHLYQPIVDLATGRVVELEALIRWHHPRRGILPPSEFIPLAEESDLIVEIGAWGIGEACRQLGRWKAERPNIAGLRIAVNLSARHFRNTNLAHELTDTLARNGIAPTELCLEVTETTLMRDVEATVAAITALKRLGFEIAIDDFGTGYSSLSYLQRLPVDVLKVDRAFVSGLGEHHRDSAIVAAAVAMAHALDLLVVAEGVETDEQLAAVRDLGCDLVQGYLFSRPIPPVDAIEFVVDRLPALSPLP